MAIIEVIEHQKITIGNKFDPNKQQITKRDAEFLRQLELKQGKRIFKWGYNTVSPQQWVGIISVPSGTIEILPKILEDNNVEKIREILVHMIKIVHDVPVRKNIEAKLNIGNHGFLDILIHLFLKELEKQLRNGIYKSYRKNKENLNTIKGVIHYPENLRKNTLIKSKFVCKFSKYTEDNELNQIIRYTLELLSKIAISQRNKTFIKKLLISFDNVSSKKVTVNDVDRLTFHRNNLRFLEVINYCKMFIKETSLHLKSGNILIDFMLFDMNNLFEKYIYKIYKKAIKNGKVIFQYNKSNMLTKITSNSNKIQLKPDLIVSFPNKNIVLDIKWKSVKGFANESDVYQMNTYLDCIPNIDEGILLYPKSVKNDKIVGNYKINSVQRNGLLKIRTVDLSLSRDISTFFNYLIGLLT